MMNPDACEDVLSTLDKYQDKKLTCRDCGADFVFTASEQEFFDQKGLANVPRRCTECRLVMRAKRAGKEPELFAVQCEACGVATKVTFKPTGRKPVLCLGCMHANKNNPTVKS